MTWRTRSRQQLCLFPSQEEPLVLSAATNHSSKADSAFLLLAFVFLKQISLLFFFFPPIFNEILFKKRVCECNRMDDHNLHRSWKNRSHTSKRGNMSLYFFNRLFVYYINLNATLVNWLIEKGHKCICLFVFLFLFSFCFCFSGVETNGISCHQKQICVICERRVCKWLRNTKFMIPAISQVNYFCFRLKYLLV